jgi:CspA family cold shock protein
MPTGTVKWFSVKKGFGFITPDEPGTDLFVHHTAIAGDGGDRSLADGARVSFDSEPDARGAKAVNVKSL